VVLQGKIPDEPSSTIGSGNVAAGPKAVIMGGLFDKAGAEAIREACRATEGAKTVPWLLQDTTKPTPPLGPEYGKLMVQRVKDALAALEKEGKLDAGDDEFHWY
jgi:hypothetical protein